jgi:hypothetical protein
MNSYNHVGGDPLNATDPSGRSLTVNYGGQTCAITNFVTHYIWASGAITSFDWGINASCHPNGNLDPGAANQSRSNGGSGGRGGSRQKANAACGIAYFASRVDASIGGINYDTPGEKRALNGWLNGRTSTMRLGQSYLNRITSFYASYPNQAVRLSSRPGDPAGSFRARVVFANYANSSINDQYLDGLVGQGTVLSDSHSNAIGLWDNFDFNAGNRGFAIEAGLADIRFSRSVYCGTSGSFAIRAGVAQ